jgi:hypothetical protein
MSIEAMKQALEALENSVDLVINEADQAAKLYSNYQARLQKVHGLAMLATAHQDAITSLRQAIEQYEKQVCVACEGNPQGENIPCAICGAASQPNVTANDTKQECVSKPQEKRHEWVGLTDDEINKCCDFPLNALGMKHVRKIEAKLKKKNGQ